MLASADAVEIGGIYYNLDHEAKTAEVTRNPNQHGGSDYEAKTAGVTSSPNQYEGDVAIPESVTYDDVVYSVTSIADGAFYGCSDLISITIPSSVTSIGEWAFSGCSGLTSITIPNGVISIGDYAFQSCTSLTSITIPSSVTSIGKLPFFDCSGLKSIAVENGNPVYDSREDCNAIIKTSDNELISGCMNTTIPNSVTKIGQAAFQSCKGLRSVRIPNSVVSVGQNAFCNCSGMTSITIPNSVTSIGEAAFRGCSGLTAITIPNSVTSIDEYVFYECSGLTTVSIPNSVTFIDRYAFSRCRGLTAVTIPNSVTFIEQGAFFGCSGLTSISIGSGIITICDQVFACCPELTDVYCYAESVPYTYADSYSNAFKDSSIEYATLHVPAGSVSAYQAVKPWKYFKEIVALPENGTDDSDYIPFVEENKQWHVVRFTPGRKNMEEVDYYIPQGVEEINGNEYYKMKAIVNNTTEIETYLVREEKRKLYLYNPDLETEFLVFDFSLKEGDIYEGYSDELHPMVRFKVVSVGDCTEGPQIREYYYDEEADTMAVRYRYLRKWDVKYADFGGAIGPWSWVEGIGSLRNPFTSMSDGYSTLDHLTYITYNSYVGHPDNYLPFSFTEWWNGEWHGCNMPTSAESFYSEDGHHQLTYELEGKRLHVYGKVLTHGGDNNYAYFIPEPTEDSSVRKFRFKIQEIEPLPGSDGLALHATDFYVEDLNPAIDYIVVDNQGVEHTVINRAPLNVYRPFVEDGKVWVVKVTSDDEPTEEWFEYYYFDGDTIINGQAAKRMLCDRIGSWQDTSGEYVGAWYEQDKKVYYAANGKQEFELLYDFTMNSYDEMPNPDGSGSVWIVYKWTGIYTGFKGTSYTFGQERWYERVGSESWPFVNHPWGYPGDKGVLTACIVGDEVIYYNSDEGDPFGMGAKKGRFDFTHTIKIQPKAPARRGAERKQTNDAEALSVYGEYNEKQLCINFDPLDAAYQVSITDESGKTVYERAVTAITIVALNIDISTYVEGRYVVVVENSNESFTGEFEVQTTGIKVLDNLTISQSDDFYDLQGRKLSNSKWSNGQIRKGIYIKDGRKFVVK